MYLQLLFISPNWAFVSCTHLKPDIFFAFNIFGNKSGTWCLVETTFAYRRELGIVCPKSLNHIKMQLEGTTRSRMFHPVIELCSFFDVFHMLFLKTSSDRKSTFLIGHSYILSEDFLF